MQHGRKLIKPINKTRRSFIFQHKSPGVYELCQICNVAIKIDTEGAMERHKQKHIESGILTDMHCEYCNIDFNDHDTYIKHLSMHKKKHYICRFCEAKFVNFYELRKHKQELHEEMIPNNINNKGNLF